MKWQVTCIQLGKWYKVAEDFKSCLLSLCKQDFKKIEHNYVIWLIMQWLESIGWMEVKLMMLMLNL